MLNSAKHEIFSANKNENEQQEVASLMPTKAGTSVFNLYHSLGILSRRQTDDIFLIFLIFS